MAVRKGTDLWVVAGGVGSLGALALLILVTTRQSSPTTPVPPAPAGPSTSLPTPAGLVASDIGESEFTVSWTGSAEAQSYSVFIFAAPGSPAASLPPLFPQVVTEPSATFAGLQPGNAYVVDCVASAGVTSSGFSEQITVTTLGSA